MSLMDFALRSFARVSRIQRRAELNQFLCPTYTYLLDWGLTYGRFYCLKFSISSLTRLRLTVSPGRFLSVIAIKILLAYIVSTYDIKYEEGKVPKERCISYLRIPGNVNVMFRERRK